MPEPKSLPRAKSGATSATRPPTAPVAKAAPPKRVSSRRTEIETGPQRLQKLIAQNGIASRRAAEALITDGRVTVNGHIIRELGYKADPAVDHVIVDGRPVRARSGPLTVVLLHKPKGYVTTKVDPEGRPTVMDLLPAKYRNLNPVGRLDYDTSGLLLLTDDGSLIQLLTHPSHGVTKTYWARVSGTVVDTTIKKLEAGIRLEDGKTAPCRARVRAQTIHNALVEVTLHEGRNRQVRRMLEAVDHPVRALRRIGFGGLDLEGVPIGTHRVLLPGEVHQLRKSASAKEAPERTSRPRRKPTRQQVAQTPLAGRAPASKSGQQRPAITVGRPARSGAAGAPTPGFRVPRVIPPVTTGRTTTAPPASQRTVAPRPTTAPPATGQAAAAGRGTGRPLSARPATERLGAERPTDRKPTMGRPTTGRPTTGRPTTGRPTTRRPLTEWPTTERPSSARPTTGRPSSARPTMGRPTPARPATERYGVEGPTAGRPSAGRPLAGRSETGRAAGERPAAGKPARPSGYNSAKPASRPSKPAAKPASARGAAAKAKAPAHPLAKRIDRQWGQKSRKQPK